MKVDMLFWGRKNLPWKACCREIWKMFVVVSIQKIGLINESFGRLGWGIKLDFGRTLRLMGESLTSLFPWLFVISNQKKVVGNMGIWENDRWRWLLTWMRTPFEWESKLIIQFSPYLFNVQVQKDFSDYLLWMESTSCSFSSNSVYQSHFL